MQVGVSGSGRSIIRDSHEEHISRAGPREKQNCDVDLTNPQPPPEGP